MWSCYRALYRFLEGNAIEINITSIRFSNKQSFVLKEIACAQGRRQRQMPAAWDVQGRVLRAMWGWGPQKPELPCAQLSDWLVSRWRFKHHQPPDFNRAGVHVLVLGSFQRFHRMGVCFLQNSLGIPVRSLSVSFRALAVLLGGALQSRFCSLETMCIWDRERVYLLLLWVFGSIPKET